MNRNILNLRHLTVLLMLCTAFLGGTIPAFAQQGGKKITGQVIDENKEPMIGVSIGRFDIGIGGVFQDVELYDTYCDYIWKYNANSNVRDYMWVEENVRTSSTNKLRGGFNVRIGVNF